MTQTTLGKYGYTLNHTPANGGVRRLEPALDLLPELWVMIFECIGQPGQLVPLLGVCLDWKKCIPAIIVKIVSERGGLIVGKKDDYWFTHGERPVLYSHIVTKKHLKISLSPGDRQSLGWSTHSRKKTYVFHVALHGYESCAFCKTFSRGPWLKRHRYTFCGELCFHQLLGSYDING